jgi:hypothetical protein
MRARVLVTDGSRTIDVLWLEHKGRDVYWGMPGFAHKRSYHASGQIHTKHGGRPEDVVHHTPLARLKGQFHLTSMTLGNVRGFVRAAAQRYEYSGRNSDVVLTVDARSVPATAQTCIMMGLLEPRNARALISPLSLRMPLPGDQLLPQQMIVSTAVEPWVYASVYWWIRGAS